MSRFASASPLLKVERLRKSFPLKKPLLSRLTQDLTVQNKKLVLKPLSRVHALNEVSFSLFPGETLALVGESGCGKSTLARAALRLLPIDSGNIFFEGKAIHQQKGAKLRELRSKMQLIFQNPLASLNPRFTVEQTLLEPIRFHFPDLTKKAALENATALLQAVGGEKNWLTRYPNAFSGGQQQRIAVARALSVKPEVVVADEPVSALDVSIQAQLLNLFSKLQQRYKISYLFITHDLSVVRYFADRIAVMYLGAVCELAPTTTLFTAPRHPYTKALLSAIPEIKPTKQKPVKLGSEQASPINLRQNYCAFAPRCPHQAERCWREKPLLKKLAVKKQATVKKTGVTTDLLLPAVACHAVEEGRL